MPCPISERAMRITTLSSGWITTQQLSSCTSAALADANGKEKPSEKAPAAAVLLTRKLRRLREERASGVWIVMAPSP